MYDVKRIVERLRGTGLRQIFFFTEHQLKVCWNVKEIPVKGQTVTHTFEDGCYLKVRLNNIPSTQGKPLYKVWFFDPRYKEV